MANLKELRRRINSVASTMQTTSAMKLVSASKLKKAQDAITSFREYSERLQEVIYRLNTSVSNGNYESAFSEKREGNKILVLIVTSNRGLCGGFNTSIFKKFIDFTKNEGKGAEITALCIGKKGYDLLKRLPDSVLKGLKKNESIISKYNFEEVRELGQTVINDFLSQKYDAVHVIYNQFKNAAVQIQVAKQLLPFLPEEKESSEANSSTDYILEPSAEEIVKSMTPLAIIASISGSILDSIASEHGARMTAMHKATDNASDLKRDLTLQYNKSRQAAITTEIIEIVSGSKALG